MNPCQCQLECQKCKIAHAQEADTFLLPLEKYHVLSPQYYQRFLSVNILPEFGSSRSMGVFRCRHIYRTTTTAFYGVDKNRKYGAAAYKTYTKWSSWNNHWDLNPLKNPSNRSCMRLGEAQGFKKYRLTKYNFSIGNARAFDYRAA